MVDSAMVERWNVLESAEMAVRIKGVLFRVLQQKPFPFDFEESVSKAIDFLKEAANGGEIILGTFPSTSSFEGTLSPLCWAAEAHFGISSDTTREDDAYKELVKTLESYSQQLETLRAAFLAKNKFALTDREDFEGPFNFFKALASVLLQQSDPTVMEYSHPVE